MVELKPWFRYTRKVLLYCLLQLEHKVYVFNSLNKLNSEIWVLKTWFKSYMKALFLLRKITTPKKEKKIMFIELKDFFIVTKWVTPHLVFIDKHYLWTLEYIVKLYTVIIYRPATSNKNCFWNIGSHCSSDLLLVLVSVHWECCKFAKISWLV